MVYFKSILISLLVLMALMFQSHARRFSLSDSLEPVKAYENQEYQEYQDRPKREHHEGITGPVHTFVKTDKHANFKWGVRHHVGHHYG